MFRLPWSSTRHEGRDGGSRRASPFSYNANRGSVATELRGYRRDGNIASENCSRLNLEVDPFGYTPRECLPHSAVLSVWDGILRNEIVVILREELPVIWQQGRLHHFGQKFCEFAHPSLIHTCVQHAVVML